MKVVLAGSQSWIELLTEKIIYNNLADAQNIVSLCDYYSVKEFLLHRLLGEQAHIDAVILADRIPGDELQPTIVSLIRDCALSFSKNNLKLNAIPVILFDKDVYKGDAMRGLYDIVADENNMHFMHSVVAGIQRLVKNFRSSIFADLDRLNISFNDLQAGKFERGLRTMEWKFRNDPEYWSKKTEVLSESFIRSPRKLHYAWLRDQRSRFEEGLDRYQHILNTIHKFDRRHSEKKILHALFNDHRWILEKDIYQRSFYEPAMDIDGRHYEEPDYLLSASLNEFLPVNVLEVKNPDMKFIQHKQRKPVLVQSLNQALVQAGDYRDYFRSAKGRNELQSLLEMTVTHINYTLLAGRKKYLEENPERIEALLKRLYAGIVLKTHDDNFDESVLFEERSRRLNIYHN